MKVESTHVSYEDLSDEDKRVLKEIDSLLEQLSNKGQDYWELYYT